MFYAIGSFLFAFAFLAALAIIAGNLLAYRHKMLAALRTLSLDRVGPPAARGRTGGPLAGPRLTAPRLARPVPRAAAL